jgi:GntR family transcriptional regulator/MocR family aminotransferase
LIGSYLPAVPALIQAAAAEFIDKGHFATHIRKAKKVYMERYQALSIAIQQHLHEYLELISTETGFHALALFKKDFDEREVKQVGVLVRPLSNYCIEPLTGVKGIALGYGCVTPVQIEEAVIKLRQIFALLG